MPPHTTRTPRRASPMSDPFVLDAAYVYPLCARALALVARRTRGFREPRHLARVLDAELRARDDGEVIFTVVTRERRMMSHPERVLDGIVDAARAYADGGVAVELRTPVALGTTIRIRIARGARDDVQTEVIEDEDGNAWTGRTVMQISFTCRIEVVHFFRRTYEGFIVRARAAMESTEIDATLMEIDAEKDGVDDAQVRVKRVASASESTSLEKKVVVSRVVSDKSTWCATCRVEIARVDSESSIDGVSVWINGSLLPWCEANLVFEHIFCVEATKFAAFALPPLRPDLSRESNPEHIIYFAPPTVSAEIGAFIRRVTVHLMNFPNYTKREDVIASGCPLSGVKHGERTVMLADSIRSAGANFRVRSELVSTGIFDALRAFKRDDPSVFCAPSEKPFMSQCERILGNVLGILEKSTRLESVHFLKRLDNVENDWRSRALRKLQTSTMSSTNNVHELM